MQFSARAGICKKKPYFSIKKLNANLQIRKARPKGQKRKEQSSTRNTKTVKDTPLLYAIKSGYQKRRIFLWKFHVSIPLPLPHLQPYQRPFETKDSFRNACRCVRSKLPYHCSRIKRGNWIHFGRAAEMILFFGAALLILPVTEASFINRLRPHLGECSYYELRSFNNLID